MTAQRPGNGSESLATLLHRVRLLAGDLLLLVMLDARQSAHRALEIVVVVVVDAVLLVSAWLALMVALSGWLLGTGTSWPVVLLVAAMINVVVALALARWLRRRLHEPFFAATLRQLRADPAKRDSS